MVELKRLSKTYRPKNGTPVKALKDVSLSFEDSGLVFLLGKSGSGKSTLLNLIGGLDVVDGGEIVIDGKSTRYFKQAEYDSYRNTYIGFVFQEYNLLDEFTVGENISLALELQNQKADKEKVEEILKEVDLEGYAGRKTNELSGGQKQRVAIARAIVKNPKIIMADEPTGALDSNTGRAILDTLKKLSKDKLVIVVSHDREFAEAYGDRIIELADGEVVADSAKSEQSAERAKEANSIKLEAKGSNLIKSRLPYAKAFKMGAKSLFTKPIRLIITIILCLVSFAFFGIADTLTAYNFNKVALNALMKDQSDTLAFSRGFGALDEDLTKIKEKTGIESLGVATMGYSSQDLPIIYRRRVSGNNGGAYYNTQLCGYLPANKVIDGEKYKLIAGKMPEQLDEIVVSKYTYEQFALGGITVVDGEDTVYIEPEEISTPQDFLDKACIQLLSDDGFDVEWKVVGIVDTLVDPDGRYEQLRPDAKSELSQKQYKFLSAECMSYFYYSYHSLGFVSQETYEAILALNDVGSAVGVRSEGSYSLTYVNYDGEITKCGGTFNDVAGYSALSNLDVIWADGVTRNSLADNELVVGIDVIRDLANAMASSLYYHRVNVDRKYFGGFIDFSKFDNITIGYVKEIGLAVGACESAEKLTLSDLSPFVAYMKSIGGELDEDTRAYCQALALSSCFNSVAQWSVDDSDYELNFYSPDDFSLRDWQMIYAGYLMNEKIENYSIIDDVYGGYNESVIANQPSGKELESKYAQALYDECMINVAFEMEFDAFKYHFVFSNDEQTILENSTKIVGVYLSSGDTQLVINPILYKEAQSAPTPDYAFLIAPMTYDKAALSVLSDMHFDEEIYVHNAIMLAIGYRNETFEGLGKIFLYVGLGLAVFSILLMGNFITATVASQKREIGILRALGAKTSDVFAIFYSESLIISIINFVLATVAAWVTSLILSAQVAKDLALNVALMTFGIRQVALVLLLSVGVSLVASLLSIYSIAKRKPIDCILDK